MAAFREALIRQQAQLLYKPYNDIPTSPSQSAVDYIPKEQGDSFSDDCNMPHSSSNHTTPRASLHVERPNSTSKSPENSEYITGEKLQDNIKDSKSPHNISSDLSRLEETSDADITESESLWSSDFSDSPAVIEEGHPLFHYKYEFLEIVLTAYRAWRVHQSGETASGSGENAQGSHESVDTTKNKRNSDNTRKRNRSTGANSSNEVDGGTERASTRRRLRERRLCLACPFAKKDPIRHRDCYRYILTRIRDVKQHLYRCHRIPIYCPRCRELFEEEEERDRHIRANDCPEMPFVRMEGVSESQKARLSQRVSSKMTEDLQWFAVFDILFPGHPQPKSPYIDRSASEEMYMFRDYLVGQGPTLLAGFLNNKGAVTWNTPQEERQLADFQTNILSDGLQLLFDGWESANAATASSHINQDVISDQFHTRDSAIGSHDASSTFEAQGSQQRASASGLQGRGQVGEATLNNFQDTGQLYQQATQSKWLEELGMGQEEFDWTAILDQGQAEPGGL